MNHEVTLANAEWCRKQAAKYLKLAASIEEILTDGRPLSEEKGGKSLALFPQNNRAVTFEQVQEEAAAGGRAKNVAERLKCDEDYVRQMLAPPNSKFFIGDKGWIRPLGWVEPKK